MPVPCKSLSLVRLNLTDFSSGKRSLHGRSAGGEGGRTGDEEPRRRERENEDPRRKPFLRLLIDVNKQLKIDVMTAVAQGDGFGVTFKGVSRTFQGKSKDISRLLWRSFREVFSRISNFVKEIFSFSRGKRA